MTQEYKPATRRGQWREPAVRQPAPPLSLRQTVPPGWQQDRPAYAGDPFMDWESGPEAPPPANLGFAEKRPGPTP